VEFALCLIPLLMLVMGIIDFGSYYFYSHEATNASRAGARYATHYKVDGSPTPTAAQIQTWLQTNYGLDAAYTVTTVVPVTGALTVTVTKNISWFLAGFDIFNLPTQVSSSTTMTLE